METEKTLSECSPTATRGECVQAKMPTGIWRERSGVAVGDFHTYSLESGFQETEVK